MSIADVEDKWRRIIHLKAVANNPSESKDARAAAQAEIETLMNRQESTSMPLDLQEVMNAPEVPFDTAPAAPPQEEFTEEMAKERLIYLNGAVVNEDGEVVDRMRILEILNWAEMPEELSEQQADQVAFKMAQAQRDIKSFHENAEKLAKPIQGWYGYLYDTFAKMLHQYGRKHVARITRGENKGKVKQKYVQLPSGRIKMGKGAGGVSVFDAEAYHKWKNSLTVEQLTEYGGYIRMPPTKVDDLHQDDYEFLKECGAEIHFGEQVLEKLIASGVHIPGTKVEPIDEIGIFKGVE